MKWFVGLWVIFFGLEIAIAAQAKRPPRATSVVTVFAITGDSPLLVPGQDPATITVWVKNETAENLSFQYPCVACGCGLTDLKYCGPLLAPANCTTTEFVPIPCWSAIVAYGDVRLLSPSGHKLTVVGEFLPGHVFGGNDPRDIWVYHITWTVS